MFRKKQDWTIKKGDKKENEKTRLKEKGISGMVSDEVQGTPYGVGSFGPSTAEEDAKPKSKKRNLLE